MLRAARELLALRSPLDAALVVSEMLGTWWGQRAPRASAHSGADLRTTANAADIAVAVR